MYIEILEGALGNLRKQAYTPGRILLQADGDGAFTGQLTREWYRDHGCAAFLIPSYSGDLAPIETAWAQLDKRVEQAANASKKWRVGVDDTPNNRRQWRELVMKELWAMPNSYFHNLSAGMPHRVRQLIDAQGGRIRS